MFGVAGGVDTLGTAIEPRPKLLQEHLRGHASKPTGVRVIVRRKFSLQTMIPELGGALTEQFSLHEEFDVVAVEPAVMPCKQRNRSMF